jgi:hypothetical protein
MQILKNFFSLAHFRTEPGKVRCPSPVRIGESIARTSSSNGLLKTDCHILKCSGALFSVEILHQASSADEGFGIQIPSLNEIWLNPGE